MIFRIPYVFRYFYIFIFYLINLRVTESKHVARGNVTKLLFFLKLVFDSAKSVFIKLSGLKCCVGCITNRSTI